MTATDNLTATQRRFVDTLTGTRDRAAAHAAAVASKVAALEERGVDIHEVTNGGVSQMQPTSPAHSLVRAEAAAEQAQKNLDAYLRQIGVTR